MDYPDNIAELERELRRVVEIVERDEEAVGRSKRPKVESIFLASSTKLRNDIQRRLRTAMAERAPIWSGNPDQPRHDDGHDANAVRRTGPHSAHVATMNSRRTDTASDRADAIVGT